MAEAACLLLLEREEDVLARGARPYAEIAGLRFDERRIAHDCPAGRRERSDTLDALSPCAKRSADPSEVVHVNAHGSSTLLNDPTESKAIRAALGEHADTVTRSPRSKG